jgi:hypothetical protein
MATYTLIDKSILGSSQTSVSFTGLGAYSSDYTDLELVYSVRDNSSNSGSDCSIKFNGSSSNYTNRLIYGNGSSAVSPTYTGYIHGGYINTSITTSNTFGSHKLYIPNYSSSNFKSTSLDSVQENNATLAYSMLSAGLWSDTSAITSIAITIQGGHSFVSGSSFYLYGIKNS